MPIYVPSDIERARAQLLMTMIWKHILEGVPKCSNCEGRCHEPIDWRAPGGRLICSTCMGVGIDLEVLPDKGERFAHFGHKVDEVDEEFLKKNWGEVYAQIMKEFPHLGSHRLFWEKGAGDNREQWSYYFEVTQKDFEETLRNFEPPEFFPTDKICLQGKWVRISLVVVGWPGTYPQPATSSE